MAQVMSATQAKSACVGAGAPDELMKAAEAKGLDLNALFQAYQQISTILHDATKSTAEKTWAIITVVVTTLFAQTGSAP